MKRHLYQPFTAWISYVAAKSAASLNTNRIWAIYAGQRETCMNNESGTKKPIDNATTLKHIKNCIGFINRCHHKSPRSKHRVLYLAWLLGPQGYVTTRLCHHAANIVCCIFLGYTRLVIRSTRYVTTRLCHHAANIVCCIFLGYTYNNAASSMRCLLLRRV